VCLVTSLVGSRGKADCAAEANIVTLCEASMRKELFIVDGHPACRRPCTISRQDSICSTGGYLFAGGCQ
jgi:hypothetical protein